MMSNFLRGEIRLNKVCRTWTENGAYSKCVKVRVGTHSYATHTHIQFFFYLGPKTE